MKHKLLCLLASCSLVTGVLFYSSCNRTPSGNHPSVSISENELLITEAKAYFEKEVLPMYDPDSTFDLADARMSLHKSPLWSEAEVQELSIGKAVVVPVEVREPLFVKLDNGAISLSASEITWMLVYQDNLALWHAEVVTKVPDDSYLQQLPTAHLFSGKVRVEDWQGRFLKGFLYLGDSTFSVASSRIYRRDLGSAAVEEPPNSRLQTLRAAPATPAGGLCSETDWYGCATIGDGPVQCSYVYTSEDCPGNLSAPSSEPVGVPTSGDYGSIGTGGAASGTPAAQSITCDTSISQHPVVACVYNHLMSTQLQYGLKSILSSFDDNTVYNINFIVSPDLASDGMTSYKGNNTFLVQINQSDADDSTYSRIYLASIFIHEAFHAKLRQRALEVFGEAEISAWPTPIDDMTLSELASYFEADAKSANVWESVEHDWMINNIAQLGTSLQNFVQTFYTSTYASVGDSLAPYEAVMYMGLQGSTLYQEEVVGKGQEAQMEKYWGDLNEGGKCQD